MTGTPNQPASSDAALLLPPPDEWNAAVKHSTGNPNHILGPYEDLAGAVHMECITCGYDSAAEVTARD